MLQSRKLQLYPTSRAIRSNLEELLRSDSFLPKLLTIGEFEKKAIVIDNRVFIDDDTRVLLLKEASDFQNFSELQIDRDFFIFLKNSKFIFSFFDELAMEKLEISKLSEVDIYASFLEHLEILERLKKRYIELLDKYNYCDKILLPLKYELNKAYLLNFDEITLYLEGYLNNFEFEFFQQVSTLTTLQIDIYTNEFNQKMIDKFNSLGFDLKRDFHYRLDLGKKEILSSHNLSYTPPLYNLFSSNSRMLQTAFVKKSIYDFVQSGVDPKDIVVITPESSFVEFLDLMDDENNFNFAMGKSFVHTKIYKKLYAIYEYMLEESIENKMRLTREGIDLEKEQERLKRYRSYIQPNKLGDEFLYFIEKMDGEEIDIYKKELHLFSKLFPNFHKYKFQHILHLFLNRLKSATIDDKSGGKITVMEILETRGVSYRGVIVVDFNDGVVPARSTKDMFLSTDIRAKASLPTPSDRENLQKYYYKRLFDKAEFVNISYVNDEQNSPSRFIDELGITSEKPHRNLEEYHDILFEPSKQKDHFLVDDIKMEWDFTKIKLSATALRDYLDCKRRYYYKYIRQLKEATIPSDEKDDRYIGIYIHGALNEFYKERKSIDYSDELLLFLQKKLYERSASDLVLRFHIDMWLERLKKFTLNEVEHFKKGYRVAECEKELKSDFKGFTLTGKIDRIDMLDDFFYVIDYKSGKIPETNAKKLESVTDFQLQFYHILVESNIGKVAGEYYYDLKSGKLVLDEFAAQKLELFDSCLDELKEKNQNFTMTDDLKKCKFCPYKIVCNRMD